MKAVRVRQFALAVLAAAIGGIAAATPASPAPPEWHFSFEYDGLEQSLCGMTVRLDGFLHGTFHEKQRSDGSVLVGFNEHYSVRLTNLATGRWVLDEFNGISKDLRVTDEGDGIITVIGAVAGIERVFAPDGTRAFQASGRTLTQLRIDLMDPGDPDDDVVLDEMVERAGLHFGAADCDALRVLMG